MDIRASSALLAAKKIVILIGHFERGGSERQAYLLARELRQRHGLDAQVWSLLSDGYDGNYAAEFEAAGVPVNVVGFRMPQTVIPFSSGFHWAHQLQRVARRLRSSNIDILLPFTTWPNVVAGLTYRLARIPLSIWGERHCGGERIPGLEWIAARQYRRFVANSTAGVEFLADEMRVSRKFISFVPNGVEEPKFTRNADWRAKLRLKPGELLVVKVANVTARKDHETLLRAWKIVQDNWPDRDKPFLALAGFCQYDDVYRNCRRIVREAALDSTVRFLESIPDVGSLIHACDIAVLSSRDEGMPNGVLECMAAGKAVIASDLPGIRDALGADGEEMLVPPGNYEKFARTILSLLRNGEKRQTLGEANRARIRDEFSVSRMTERHLQIMEGSLPNPAPAVDRMPKVSMGANISERQ